MKLKPTDMTRRVALYQSPHGSVMLWECGKDPDVVRGLDQYARVSEVLELTVTPLTPEEIHQGQLRALYRLRAEVKAKADKELAVLDGRIQSLRALPAPESK